MLALLALAFSVFVTGIKCGELGAKQCAIDYPHDGQCGLVVMEGASFGAVEAIVTIVTGLVFLIRSVPK